MKYYVVNRNSLDSIDLIESETETALEITDCDGVKYTRFGTTKFLFKKKQDAIDLADRLLDEEIYGLETRLDRSKQKKTKLAKVK